MQIISTGSPESCSTAATNAGASNRQGGEATGFESFLETAKGSTASKKVDQGAGEKSEIKLDSGKEGNQAEGGDSKGVNVLVLAIAAGVAAPSTAAAPDEALSRGAQSDEGGNSSTGKLDACDAIGLEPNGSNGLIACLKTDRQANGAPSWILNTAETKSEKTITGEQEKSSQRGAQGIGDIPSLEVDATLSSTLNEDPGDVTIETEAQAPAFVDALEMAKGGKTDIADKIGFRRDSQAAALEQANSIAKQAGSKPADDGSRVITHEGTVIGSKESESTANQNGEVIGNSMLKLDTAGAGERVAINNAATTEPAAGVEKGSESAASAASFDVTYAIERGLEGVKPAASEAASNAQKDVLGQVLDGVSGMSVPRNRNMRVQLNPPELGRVELRLGLKDGAVTLHITAESAGTKGLIEMALPQLRHALQARDIQLGDLTLGLSGGGSGSLGGWSGSSSLFSEPSGQWGGAWHRSVLEPPQSKDQIELLDIAVGRGESAMGSHLVDYRI